MSDAREIAIQPAKPDDVWRWLAGGWADLKAAARYSLVYGAAFTAIGLAISVGLASVGMSAVVPAAAGGFALLAPLMAVGLYEISRRLEAGEPVGWRDILLVKTKAPAQIALTSFFLLFIFMVWMRAAQLIFALFFQGDYVPLSQFVSYALTQPDGLMTLAVGTAVGAVLAFSVFAVSALSLPLMMHRPIDAVTAIGVSFRAIQRNPRAMLIWAWAIAVITAVSAATAFIGLIVAFPLLGHATWRAYRQLVDVSAVAVTPPQEEATSIDWSQDRPLP